MKLRGLFSGALVLAAIVFPASGKTHPLGNFSINRLSEIRIGEAAVMLNYVVDMAEIPTFQEIQDAQITPLAADPRLQAYMKRMAEDLRAGLLLEVNGEVQELEAVSTEAIFSPGAGALSTMKLDILYRARRGNLAYARDSRLNFRDGISPSAPVGRRLSRLENRALGSKTVRFRNAPQPAVERLSGRSIEQPAAADGRPPVF